MQTLHVFVHDMIPGDRFLSNRRGWVTVVHHPMLGLFGHETTVRSDDGDRHDFAAPGLYEVYRPSHRRDCAPDWIPTARCTCSTVVCQDTYCPKHRPTDYADQQARHATDSINGSWLS